MHWLAIAATVLLSVSISAHHLYPHAPSFPHSSARDCSYNERWDHVAHRRRAKTGAGGILLPLSSHSTAEVFGPPADPRRFGRSVPVFGHPAEALASTAKALLGNGLPDILAVGGAAAILWILVSAPGYSLARRTSSSQT